MNDLEDDEDVISELTEEKLFSAVDSIMNEKAPKPDRIPVKVLKSQFGVNQ